MTCKKILKFPVQVLMCTEVLQSKFHDVWMSVAMSNHELSENFKMEFKKTSRESFKIKEKEERIHKRKVGDL